MKKIISTIALATSIGAVFAGCGAGASDNSTGNAGGTVTTDGSTGISFYRQP